MKRMRKGTRACQECRRRKIKCFWADESSLVCQDCTENQRICTKQGAQSMFTEQNGVGKTSPLKVRVKRLETLVDRLARVPVGQLATPPEEKETSPQNSIHQRLSPPEDESTSLTIISTLFKNNVLFTPDNISSPSSINHQVHLSSSDLSKSEQLLFAIRHETSVDRLLDISNTWWEPFQVHYSNSSLRFQHEANLHANLSDFVSSNLKSSNPVNISLALLCIAASLQNLRPGVDDESLHLSVPNAEMMNRITATVDQLVLNDTTPELYSFQGVILWLLRGQLYSHGNQIRKAWWSIRQAIVVGKQINLSAEGPGEGHLFDGLLEVDRFLSMFLGLPFFPDADFESSNTSQMLQSSDVDVRMRGVRRVAALASSRIVERDASSEALALDQTWKIQQTLAEASQSLTNEWWQLSSTAPFLPLKNPLSTFEHLYAQLWLYQTQSWLQLPYMLRSTSSLEFLENRDICLTSSRQLIKIWKLLRTTPELLRYLCRLDDFQALISAVVILIGLLQCPTLGSEDITNDLELIDDVKSILESVSKEQGGMIARQGLRVLDTLSSFLDGRDGAERQLGTVVLFVPYFGAIEVFIASNQQSSGKHQTLGNLTKDGSALQNDEVNAVPQGFSTSTINTNEPLVDDVDFDSMLDEVELNWEGFLQDTSLNEEWKEMWSTQ